MPKTKIEWTEYSWNPVTGCTPISEACQNCYAQRMAKRLAGRCGYPKDEPFKVTLHPDKLSEPLKWRKPRKVFVCSMSDLFHEDVPDEYIDRIFAVMALCPQHIFMVLTKRPMRMLDYIKCPDRYNKIIDVLNRGMVWDMPPRTVTRLYMNCREKDIWPLPNVWLGTTAENQQRADERIPNLLQIPAAVRFVSIEPMLGPVDLTRIDIGGNVWINSLTGDCKSYHPYGGMWKTNESKNKLDCVICGGETGPGARPMYPAWVRSLRDQCQKAGTCFFFKSWGDWAPVHELSCNEPGVKNKPWYNFDPDTSVCRIGKKKAGRLLDGRMWDEMPEV